MNDKYNLNFDWVNSCCAVIYSMSNFALVSL